MEERDPETWMRPTMIDGTLTLPFEKVSFLPTYDHSTVITVLVYTSRDWYPVCGKTGERDIVTQIGSPAGSLHP